MVTITVYTTAGEIRQDEDARGIIDEIKKQYTSEDVTNVCLDEEFGGVSANIDGTRNVGCGFIEDILESIQWRALRTA